MQLHDNATNELEKVSLQRFAKLHEGQSMVIQNDVRNCS